jgi:hypothetical protein
MDHHIGKPKSNKFEAIKMSLFRYVVNTHKLSKSL